MVRKKSDKTRMTLYRLVGLPSKDEAIREEYRDYRNDGSLYNYKSVTVAGTEASLYWGTVEREQVGWTDIVNGLTNEHIKLGSRSASAVLVIPGAEIDESVPEEVSVSGEESSKNSNAVSTFSVWAITFGMGFQMLDQHYVDSGFGQRIAIRCATPEGLSTINKITLDEKPQMVRSTIPSGADLRSFGFEEIGDYVTKLTTAGCIDGIGTPEKPIKVSGADSLSIPLSKSPKNLLENLRQLKTVLGKEPASDELATIEHLSVVKNSEIKERLEEELITAINDCSDHVALSYPYDVIDDFGRVDGFIVSGTREREPHDGLPTIDDILEHIRGVDKAEGLRRLTQRNVRLYKSSDDADASQKIELKKWLTFQKTIEDKRYFLLNKRWYAMNSKYEDTILKQVKAIFARGPLLEDLPVWSICKKTDDVKAQKKANAELHYNQLVSDKFGGICLDQQLIRPEIGGSPIEPCDVLLPGGVFVHVKHLSSSAPASHLLSQALVATHLLRTDTNAQKQLEEKIKEIAPDRAEKYDTKPRRVVIVMAKDKNKITPSSLFTFTKINLVRYDKMLASMDVGLYVAPVIRELL